MNKTKIARIGLPRLMLAMIPVGVWSIWWTAAITWVISAFFCLMRYLGWRGRHTRL